MLSRGRGRGEGGELNSTEGARGSAPQQGPPSSPRQYPGSTRRPAQPSAPPVRVALVLPLASLCPGPPHVSLSRRSRLRLAGLGYVGFTSRGLSSPRGYGECKPKDCQGVLLEEKR